MDLRKKQAVVTLQRLFRSRKRRNMFRSVVTSAHTEYRRSTSMATLAPPPTSVYVFTPREVGEIVFDETDSEETITWGDAATESSPKLKLSGSFTGMTRQPTIKSATIVKLIEKLTCDNNDDPDFVNTVLYTMETFTTPTCFLDLLSKRYADAIALDKQPIKQKVAELLHTWVTDHPYYFELDTKFTNKFKNFVNGTVAPDFPQICGDLIEDMEARQAHKNRSMSGVTNLVEFLSNAPKSYPIPRDIPLKNLQLCLDVNPEEIARQLTLIDYFLLCRINPTEFVNQRWTRSGKEKAAGNILAMIERFNQVSQWAATEICTEESLKIRTTKIKRFIDIGMKCLELKNFNGVMQIVTGLNSSAVARLKTTWNNVSARRKEGFASLEKLMDMNNNFRNYRELLASTPPPCIPFLGLFLTDFTFIDDGNPNFSHKNQINMVKRRLTAEGMRTITQCASKPFCLVPVSVIQEKLLNCDALDDMTLYKHSLKLERKSVSQTTLRKSLASALPNLKKTSFG